MLRNDALRPFVIALAVGLAVGTAVFVIAEAISAVYLLGQQIELARTTQAALSGGIAGLADGRIRELRLAAEGLAAEVHRRVALISIGAGTVAAVVALFRSEQAGN